MDNNSIKFYADSQGKNFEISFFKKSIHRIFRGDLSVGCVRFVWGDDWAIFSLDDFERFDCETSGVIESLDSSWGSVFVANVDWAPEHSLFAQQVEGVPRGYWVICFADKNESPLKAVFSGACFQGLVSRIRALETLM